MLDLFSVIEKEKAQSHQITNLLLALSFFLFSLLKSHGLATGFSCLLYTEKYELLFPSKLGCTHTEATSSVGHDKGCLTLHTSSPSDAAAATATRKVLGAGRPLVGGGFNHISYVDHWLPTYALDQFIKQPEQRICTLAK